MKHGFYRILTVFLLAAFAAAGVAAYAAGDTLTVQPSKHNIEIMGKKADLEAYNINGYNYFKLRDIIDALGFYVAWDDALQKITVSDKPIIATTVFIIIDPGHGGRDPGAINKKLDLYEKDVNLSVALKLAKMLKDEGFIVAMTRTDDESLSVSDRMDMIITRRPDLYISVHHNASDDASRHGAYVICQVDDKNGGRTANLAGFLREEFENIGQTYLGSIYRRGSEGDYYGVLRAAASVGIPAVITEFAFIDNSTDLKLIDTDKKREKEAEAIFNAVVRFLDRPKVQNTAEEDADEASDAGEDTADGSEAGDIIIDGANGLYNDEYGETANEDFDTDNS
ncbi:MAG: N-acetylmuramoyl-L-alanine amidase [Clostridia bacterium]|nr:N-acetylmuramoyl-L-alanine amidase [Clostridia bacterium]